MDKAVVTIYTDGACSGNPGPGGYAAIIMYSDTIKEISGNSKNTTNNRMELTAAIEGLKVLTKPCKVQLYSDSAYLVNAYNNNWIDSWNKKNWKTSSGEQVKNIDLWKQLESFKDIHDIKYIKVKGHSDNKYNNRCDELAVNAIKNISKAEEIDEVKKAFGDLPTMETKRLNIRLFNDNDINDLYEYCSDAEVTKYVPFDTYTSKKDAKDRLKYIKESYSEIVDPILWAIEDKKTCKLIGGIDFVKWDRKNKVGEIGYILNRKFWGKGLMTEALERVIKFGFSEMGLNRIMLKCDERNLGSARVMEKNGLKYEGTLRQATYAKGEFISHKVYSILRDEYTKKL